jgi:MoxR-like ATPase
MSNRNTATETPTLTLQQLKRITLANYFTPGRRASTGVRDPITARQVTQADAQWALDYEAAHGLVIEHADHASVARPTFWARPDHAKAREYRQLASQTVWGACPVLVLGPPGVGKTAIGEGFAEANGLAPNTIIASQQQPEDIGGYAIPDMAAGRMVRLPDTWIDTVNGAVNGAVQCFDEITTADESMMAALLRVFSDRAAGDRTLNPRVRLIAFGNRPGEAPNARTLDPAAANRFAHFTFVGADGEGWASWLMDELDQDVSARDPNAVEARVLEEWPRAFARAKTQVAQYVKSNPGAIHAMCRGDENTRMRADHPASCGPWASHRTWEIATRVLAGAEIHGLSETETRLWLTAVIGAEADGLVTWITNQDLPDLWELLKRQGKYTDRRTGKTVTWKHDQKRLDRTYMVLTGAATTLRDAQNQHTPADLCPMADWLWGLLYTVGKKDPDMVVRSAVTLQGAGFKFLTAAMREELDKNPTDPKYQWAFRDGGAESDEKEWCNARRVCMKITSPLLTEIQGGGVQSAA